MAILAPILAEPPPVEMTDSEGLDHLENCLFSETENGCYNQKSFMQHALLALQIQFFFF